MSTGSRRHRVGAYLGYATAVLIFGFPIVLMVASGFRHGIDIPAGVLDLAKPFTAANYERIFATMPVGRYFMNSLVIAVLSTAVGLAMGVPAAYGLVRSRRRGLALVPLGVRMMPGILFLLPMATFSIWLGLASSAASIWILVLAHSIITLPLCAWLVMPAVSNVPVDVEEAAMLDGATRLRRFGSVVLPLILPSVAVAGLSSFLYSWNYFLFGLAIANEESMPITIVAFRFIGEGQNDYGGLMAMATLIAIPSFLLAVLAQRWIVRGVTDGGI